MAFLFSRDELGLNFFVVVVIKLAVKSMLALLSTVCC